MRCISAELRGLLVVFAWPLASLAVMRSSSRITATDRRASSPRGAIVCRVSLLTSKLVISLVRLAVIGGVVAVVTGPRGDVETFAGVLARAPAIPAIAPAVAPVSLDDCLL